MTRHANDPCADNIDSRRDCPRLHQNLAHGIAWHVVQAEHRIDREAVKDPLFDHAQRAADVFFRGLENQMHGAVEIAVGREIEGQSQQHGGMSVMATAMKFTLNSALPLFPRIFLHRQSIHICTEPKNFVTITCT